MDIGSKEIISLIGPQVTGKSTFLRCFNRMNDTIDGCKVEGKIFLDNENIYDEMIDVVPLRAKVGMVFQNLILFLSLFMIMWLMVLVFMV